MKYSVTFLTTYCWLMLNHVALATEYETLIPAPPPPNTIVQSIVPKKSHELLYICPMHAHIKQYGQGKCPICGMDLVVQKAKISINNKHAQNNLPSVTVSPQTQQFMAVQSTTVTKRSLPHQIDTIGRVIYNEDTRLDFVPRAAGWVETLYTDREGIRVKKGDKLLEFFSPDILVAQDGYVLALKSNFSFSGERREFFDRVAREKLKLYGLSPEVINEITTRGELRQTIPLLAPQDGIITVLDVDQGDQVSVNDRFMVIADMRSVWVEAEIYESQLALLDKTQSITISSSAFPNKQWQGKIDYISSEINPKTQTLPVRLVVDTPKELLKPNMRVSISLKSMASDAVLAVPNSAIIPDQQNTFRVVKINPNHTFQPVEVKLGQTSAHYTEIRSGLKEGDKVVTSGQFLLDSESNLQASFQRMHQ